jgi:cytochrome oxidase Cu insertion factor (SCO1/SenC/PrrC family)
VSALRFAKSIAAAVLLVLTVGCTGDPAPVNVSLNVGDAAPEFRLTDQHGKQRSLKEFLGNGSVAVVFYRSAEW